MGEEEGADEGESPHVWYVDPIDGTTNFAHGVPIFCVSMAMYTNDRPTIGVIVDPIHEEIFWAIEGEGAFLDSAHRERQTLQVSSAPALNQALLGTGFAYDRMTSEQDNLAQVNRVVKQCRGLRRLGSAALDLAYVAAGRIDGFWEFKLNMYDVAAGILLVQEAGGFVGKLLDGEAIEPADRIDILVCNPLLKEPLLEILNC